MNNLNVHYFQHIEGEGLGSCENYLRQHYHANITTTAFYALPPKTAIELVALPEVKDVDLLIIMGGTMSANEESIFPWLNTEINWIKNYIDAGKPVIGLCLGAQLIAKSLGGRVAKNPEQERGWHQVYGTELDQTDYFNLPSEITILEWHSETFSLPNSATLLAHNKICKNQAFQYKKNVIGFQFHPEITAPTLRYFFDSLHEEVAKYQGYFVQSVSQTLEVPPERYHSGQRLLEQAIDYVLQHSTRLEKFH